jgi:hypothetical protein
MGNLLLHSPLVQFYLMCVASLLITVTWDFLRTPNDPPAGPAAEC